MRLLLVADLHYALKQYDWAAAAAPAFDVVVVAGDHLDISSPLDGGVQVLVILKYLQRMARTTRLVVSSGNHDLDRRDAHGERVPAWMARVRRLGVPTDGDTLELDEARITICPWWDGPRAKAAIGEQLARDAAKPRRPWIWVYHAPPRPDPRPAGMGAAPGATRISGPGSRPTSPTSCWRGTSTRRPSSGRDPGLTGSATPGCSTRASRSGPSRRTW